MRAELQVRPEIENAEHDAALEVVVQWGENVLYAEHVRAPGELVLGEVAAGERVQQAGFVFDLSRFGVERLVLARHDGSAARLFVPGGLDARAFVEGLEVDVAQLAPDGCVELPEGTSAQLWLCGLTIHVRATRVARAASLRKVEPERLAQPWTLASLGAHLLVLGLFYVLPPASHALSMNDVDLDGRLVRFAREAQSREPEPPEWTEDERPEGEGKEGQRAAEEEGASGDPKAPKAKKRAASKGDSPTPSIASAPPDASEAGILGVLRAAAPTTSDRFTAINAIGSDPIDAMGALLGDQIGPSFGIGGRGMVSVGRGGGGFAFGTQGVGDLNTIGGAGEGDHGGGYGAQGDGLGPRISRVPRKIRIGEPDVRGSLAKETIRRIVQRHLSEVRHCYEQRLIARPDLQGRVSVRFVIAGSGLVPAAAVVSDTVEDPTVGVCIANAVKRWSFPQPQGGGVVAVTYPFVLQHTGS